MGEFLLRSHPILDDGTRCTRRDWGRLLRLKCDIRDRLRAEGVITVDTDGEIVRVAILERYKKMLGDRQGAEDGQQ
jgi:hypothetical protein